MLKLARISVKHPKLALGAWSVVAVVLVLIGLGVSHSLSPSVTVVPGTQSSRAQQLGERALRPEPARADPARGPDGAAQQAGPRARRDARPGARHRVLSAWDGGTVSGRAAAESPTAAMIVVSVGASSANAISTTEPQIEHLVSQQITAPLKSYIIGQPSIDRAEQSASLVEPPAQRGDRGRDPVPAAADRPARTGRGRCWSTAVGAVSMLAAFGEVALLGKVLTLDPVAVALGTMTGLRSASAFALFILDRFHRERRPGSDYSRDAATARGPRSRDDRQGGTGRRDRACDRACSSCRSSARPR